MQLLVDIRTETKRLRKPDPEKKLDPIHLKFYTWFYVNVFAFAISSRKDVTLHCCFRILHTSRKWWSRDFSSSMKCWAGCLSSTVHRRRTAATCLTSWSRLRVWRQPSPLPQPHLCSTTWLPLTATSSCSYTSVALARSVFLLSLNIPDFVSKVPVCLS